MGREQPVKPADLVPRPAAERPARPLTELQTTKLRLAAEVKGCRDTIYMYQHHPWFRDEPSSVAVYDGAVARLAELGLPHEETKRRAHRPPE